MGNLLIEWVEAGLRKPDKSKGGLARALDVQNSTISKILSGSRAIKVQELVKIADYLGEPVPSLLLDAAHLKAKVDASKMRAMSVVTKQDTALDNNGESVRIPTHGIREIDASAGLGGGQEPQIAYRASQEGWQITDAFKPDPWILPPRFIRGGLGAPADKIIAIETQGDSMSPTIGHGDVVFVDTRHTRISPPGLYAIRDIYGEIIVKRLAAFQVDGDPRVQIISDNSHEPPREEPLSEITVVGRVCGMFRLT